MFIFTHYSLWAHIYKNVRQAVILWGPNFEFFYFGKLKYTYEARGNIKNDFKNLNRGSKISRLGTILYKIVDFYRKMLLVLWLEA